MFKRLELEPWHEVIPYVAFALTFGIFLLMVIRAIRMKKSAVDRMAALPLERGSAESARKD